MMRARIAIAVGLVLGPGLRAPPRPRRASPTRSREPATAGPGWRSRPRRGCAPAWWSARRPAPSRDRELRLPRTLVQLDERTWLVADLADWTRPRGVIWKMTAAPGQPVQLAAVADRPVAAARPGDRSRRPGLCRRDEPDLPLRPARRRPGRHGPGRDHRPARQPAARQSPPAVAVRVRRRRRPAGQCRRAVGPVPGRQRRAGRDRPLRPVGGRGGHGRDPPLRPPRAGPLGCEVHDAGARPAQLGGPGRASVGHGAAGREQLRFRRPLEPVRGGQPHRGRPALRLALLPGHGHAHAGLGRDDGLRLQRPHPARRPAAAPRRAAGDDLVPGRDVPQAQGQAADELARLSLDRRAAGRLRRRRRRRSADPRQGAIRSIPPDRGRSARAPPPRPRC
jgi:hypothetical protein